MKALLHKLAKFIGFFSCLFAINRINLRLRVTMLQDTIRLGRHMGAFSRDTESYALAKLTFDYHRVEKGLTMPDFRYGFGHNVVVDFIQDLRQFKKKGYDTTLPTYQHALAVLKEYQRIHNEAHFELANDIKKGLDEVLVSCSEFPATQNIVSSQDFFASTQENFAQFSASRHTVRHYAGRVPEKDIIDAIVQAGNAPQACNRRFVKAHFYQGPIVQKLLAFQNGNRGFGHLCEQLIIVTGDMGSLLFAMERHDIHTNAGIFIMNLSYALHYHHVAHCLLNWWYDEQQDKEMRRIAGIPENEIVVLFIACGKAPERFALASSPKPRKEDLIVLHPEK